MTEAEAAKRLLHQERCYEEHLNQLKEKDATINFRGRKLIVSPNVLAPASWNYNMLAQTVLKEVKETDRVLDMGTGSGIQAILAASKSTNVIAVDVNPFAVKYAKLNVKLNGLSSRVKVVKSDLFKNVKGKFDLIIFDPPFRWTKPRDAWEISSADEDYRTMRTFFAGVKKYLNEGGRIVMHFGTSGDVAYFDYLIKKNGFRIEPIMKSRKNRRGWIYFTYRLTF
jgi:release factor glutamine methyltransferase